MRHARLLVPLTVLVWLSATPAAAQDCGGTTSGGEVLGTLLGAAVGGLLGSQVGSGTGNKVAIGAGVLAGGLLGNKVGRAMSCQDRQMHGQTYHDSLETQRSGTAATWTNPDTGHSGSVTPVRTYQQADGTYCRDFTQTIEVDGEVETATGTACRQPDGTWRVVG